MITVKMIKVRLYTSFGCAAMLYQFFVLWPAHADTVRLGHLIHPSSTVQFDAAFLASLCHEITDDTYRQSEHSCSIQGYGGGQDYMLYDLISGRIDAALAWDPPEDEILFSTPPLLEDFGAFLAINPITHGNLDHGYLQPRIIVFGPQQLLDFALTLGLPGHIEHREYRNHAGGYDSYDSNDILFSNAMFLFQLRDELAQRGFSRCDFIGSLIADEPSVYRGRRLAMSEQHEGLINEAVLRMIENGTVAALREEYLPWYRPDEVPRVSCSDCKCNEDEDCKLECPKCKSQ